ncbi:MAG: hypothetical protein AAFQ40_07640 [Cyanobacteria bacterium J06623_5]
MSIEQALIVEVRWLCHSCGVSLTPQQQKEVLTFAAFLRQRSPQVAEGPTDKALVR